MFNFWKKKQPLHGLRDMVFGDLPLAKWPESGRTVEREPWKSFSEAREHQEAYRRQSAMEVYQRILAMPNLESHHYLQAGCFLRALGGEPDASLARQVLGVVVEVNLRDGADTLAAYADGTARYYNHGGGAIVWEAPENAAMKEKIDDVLRAGQVVADTIGACSTGRPPRLAVGQASITVLTPGGMGYGVGPCDKLFKDALGGPAFAAATMLIQSLNSKVLESKC